MEHNGINYGKLWMKQIDGTSTAMFVIGIILTVIGGVTGFMTGGFGFIFLIPGVILLFAKQMCISMKAHAQMVIDIREIKDQLKDKPVTQNEDNIKSRKSYDYANSYNTVKEDDFFDDLPDL